MRSHVSLLLPLAVLALATGCPPATDTTDTDTGSDTDDTGSDTDDTGETDDTGGGTAFTDCATDLAPAAEGVCDVAVGGGDATVIKGWILGPDEVYVGGSVVLDGDGAITCTGCDCDDPADATVITCADGVVSPGLIDAHEHIGFSEGEPLTYTDKRYDHRHGWRGDSAVRTPQNASGFDGQRWVELRKIFGGATSMAGSGHAFDLVRNLDRDENALDPRLGTVNYSTFPLGDANRQFRSNCGWDYDEDAYDLRGDGLFLPHVAEGIDDFAAEEIRCLSTDLEGGEDIVQPNVSFIHAVGLQATDYDNMVRRGTALVWSPRSNLQLYGETARVTVVDTLGGVIALGADWVYSGSVHPGREMACAAQFNETWLDGHFSDRDIWEMATLNAAIATDAEGLLGVLEPGAIGDIAVFAGASAHADSPWRATFDGAAGEVALVLRAGTPLYGEADVVTPLDDACEALDVCGNPHAICMATDTGETFAALQGELSGDPYPAFFCDVPEGEPLCEPIREGDWPGIPADGDGDGDGVADDDDLCPTVFDPIRPIDEGAQADADGDGVGDACDDTPLGTDFDGDGVDNLLDNCPYVDNNDQADSDGDDRGDACDDCPELPNAETACPDAPAEVASIRDVRDDQSTYQGRSVRFEGAVVTGTYDDGFAIQSVGADGGDAGIMVYLGDAPQVAAGDVVTVEGPINDYFDELQVERPDTVTKTGTAMLPEPVALTAAEAGGAKGTSAPAEAYEGMLVAVSGEVSDPAHDCSTDPDASGCADDNLWEIGGESGVVVFDRFYSGSNWVAGEGEVTVRGIMTTRWNRRRVMPRSDTDLPQ